MRLVIGKQIRESAALRQSFFSLAQSTFEIDFSPWHAKGFWGERYLPYALAEEDRIVSNISVNVLDVLYDGAPRRYVQLGTVMSDPAFRGRGLSRRLMEKVLADWRGNCDMIYLYANDTVLDFYPKFGFERFIEHSQMYSLRPAPGDFVPLDLSREENLALFSRLYAQNNPFSCITMQDNFGLVMFYCGSVFADNVFYSKKRDAVCIALQEGETLSCLDIFCAPGQNLREILSETAAPGTTVARLGFAAKREGIFAPILEDDALFVLPGKDNPFAQEKICMPLLSHA